MTRRLVPAAALLLAAVLLAGASDKRFYGDAAGYLPRTLDVRSALPPAPRPGDARDAADRRIFRETRAMIGTPRYALATADAVIDPAALALDFSCAAGVALDPQRSPRTVALVTRATVDTGRANSDAKDFYRRLRPFQVDAGAICQPERQLAGSYDYPSGHTSYGWTWALVLSELLPDRAPAILARGRAYGDSRFVCGAHNYSAVQAGFVSADVTMAAVRRTPAFQADAAAARDELARLRADPAAPRPGGCEAEAALEAQPLP